MVGVWEGFARGRNGFGIYLASDIIECDILS